MAILDLWSMLVLQHITLDFRRFTDTRDLDALSGQPQISVLTDDEHIPGVEGRRQDFDQIHYCWHYEKFTCRDFAYTGNLA